MSEQQFFLPQYLEVGASNPELREMLAPLSWSGLLFTTTHRPSRNRETAELG